MCSDAKSPHLRTYTIRFLHSGPDEYYCDATARAQGVRWDVDTDRVELWRRIEAGDLQVVASFRAAKVLGVFADAADADLTVPDGWQTTRLGGGAPAPATVSDEDVPF